jgi:hypothetical protein
MAVKAATLHRSGMLRTGSVRRPHPSLFFIPGLTSKPRWTLDEVPSVRPLLAALPAIVRDYEVAKAALPSTSSVREGGEHSLISGQWEWRSAVAKGVLQAPFQAACPTTASLLMQMPDLLLNAPFAYAFFSTLLPGTSIVPHFGPANMRLRVHIPLPGHVPSANVDELGISIAGEAATWDASGAPLIFDDTYEHYVWNKTEHERGVLLLDVWHPDLSVEERSAIVAMWEEARAQGWM